MQFTCRTTAGRRRRPTAPASEGAIRLLYIRCVGTDCQPMAALKQMIDNKFRHTSSARARVRTSVFARACACPHVHVACVCACCVRMCMLRARVRVCACACALQAPARGRRLHSCRYPRPHERSHACKLSQRRKHASGHSRLLAHMHAVTAKSRACFRERNDEWWFV